METHETSYYDLLITKYYSGEASGEEQDELASWIALDPDHLSRFEQFGLVHDMLMKQAIEPKVNLEEEWNTFREKAGLPEGHERHPFVSFLWPAKPFTLSHIARLAAVIILLLIPTYLLINVFFGSKYETLIAAEGIREVTLPDGSVVVLNKGAVIQYPVKFNRKTREVIAAGEMHFRVIHQPDHVFNVHAGGLKVSVLGTEFYLKAPPKGTDAHVILEKGKVVVSFQDQPEQQTILAPGEEAIISITNKTITRQINADPNYMAWQTKQINFDQTPLPLVASTLSAVYGNEIILSDPELNTCYLTASFENQSLESILSVIEATLDVTVIQHGQQVVIRGQGCLKQ